MLQSSGAKSTSSGVSSYIPGSAEKKKGVMMYLGIGLLLSLTKAQMSRFEYFHLKQALGRRLVFILVVLVATILLFLPIVRFLGWLVIMAMLVIVGLFIKQAWDGVAYDTVESAQIPLFIGVGGRLVQMFDTTIHVEGQDQVDIPEEPQTDI